VYQKRKYNKNNGGTMIFNIWLTRKCNLKCTYCYEGKDKSEAEMNIETAVEVINFIKSYMPGSICVNFHGGEPLLAMKILRYIVGELQSDLENTSINYGLTTNGTILEDDIIIFLSKIMPHGLTISIDGSEMVHDTNRKYANGTGSYKKVEQNLLKIIELIPDCRARATYNHKTIGHLCESVIHLVNKGFKTIVAIGDYYDLSWEDEDEKILKHEIKKLHKLYESLSDKENIRINLLDKNLVEYSSCQGGITSVNIDTDGTLYPCTVAVGNSEYIIGNVTTGINENRVEEILDLGTEMNEECKACPVQKNCNGVRCKLMNKIISGDCLAIPVFLCVEKNAIFDS